MAACRLGEPGFQSDFLEGALQDGLVQVVPPLFPGAADGVMAGGEEAPLPCLFLPGVGVLALQRIRRTTRPRNQRGILSRFADSVKCHIDDRPTKYSYFLAAHSESEGPIAHRYVIVSQQRRM